MQLDTLDECAAGAAAAAACVSSDSWSNDGQSTSVTEKRVRRPLISEWRVQIAKAHVIWSLEGRKKEKKNTQQPLSSMKESLATRNS